MHQYFCGWYYRCQSEAHTLAIIPSIHKTRDGDFASIQLITDDASCSVSYPISLCRQIGDELWIGQSRFTRESITLRIRTPELTATGSLRFGARKPLRYDIMGPFQYVPFLQCTHRVYSMHHRVDGEVMLNGKPITFQNANGYTEGDRGRSFPSHYVWTQAFIPGGSVMLSVAQIPMGPTQFTGIIGFVYLKGKEYRIATYLGARVAKLQNREIHIRQGRLNLKVKAQPDPGHPLLAPIDGAMHRTIHEHPSCGIHCRFERKGKVLLDAQIPNAAFEYEY